MKIKALAPWFGSKRTLAPDVVAELGRHSAYWEPFCGSMAVLLLKDRVAMETVNDLHADLINLARVLASEKAVELYEMVSRSLMHSDLFADAKRECFAVSAKPAESVDEVEDWHVRRAWAYFILSWQGRNGSSGTGQGNLTVARRFTHNGGSGGLRWKSAVDSIPAWHNRLREVSIQRMDAFEMIERIADQEGSAIYVDPPYIKKGTKYVHDFDERFWLFDDGRIVSFDHCIITEKHEPKPRQITSHERLAIALKRFSKARVVVSYYDDPALADLYPGWTKRDVAISKSLVNQGMRDKKGPTLAPEVLLLNGPSFVARSEKSLFAGGLS